MHVETLGEYFTALAGKRWHSGTLMEWPPDVFCLAASLLQRTGAYIRVVRSWPPLDASLGRRGSLSAWTTEMHRRGQEWWLFANARLSGKRSSIDSEIRSSFEKIIAARDERITDLIAEVDSDKYADLWAALFEIAAAADEACAGIGLVQVSAYAQRTKTYPNDPFLWEASLKLVLDDGSATATLCRRIPPFLGSVLPKMHTPQSGLTLRSISHHLAYLRPSEVTVGYAATFSHAGTRQENGKTLTSSHALNVLLVPWPSEVRPSDFRTVDCPFQTTADGYGFFTYAPDRPPAAERAKTLERMLRKASRIVDRIDGVLMPELAIGQEERPQLMEAIRTSCPGAFLIAGMGISSSKAGFGSNVALFAAGNESLGLDVVEQTKHHRWQLNRPQIDQYGLGSALDPDKLWWEHIPIEPRRIHLVSLSDRLTLAMLICEDLARQDPIADVLRSVAPNLVVALLMDGPQLSGRWPAHYATVLADDPGSSVLTVTSIGMSHLCRPKGVSSSRVIGLWKDHIQGFREIELPSRAEAVVLTLNLCQRKEFSADGREDDGQSTYLTLNGIHPIFSRRSV